MQQQNQQQNTPLPDASSQQMQPRIPQSAFADDSTQRTLNVVGQQVPPPYQTFPVQPAQQTPPMYYAQPVASSAYLPPMYGAPTGQAPAQQTTGQPALSGQTVPQLPPSPQTAAGQSAGQPVSPILTQNGMPTGQPVSPILTQNGMPTGQPVSPILTQNGMPTGQPVAPALTSGGYAYTAPANYYRPPVMLTPEQLSRSLFKKHSSRVGFMLLADQGLMLLVAGGVMVIGLVGYYLFRNQWFPDLDLESAILNILMAGMGLAAIAGNVIPAALHGRKWQIRFAEPFGGDRLGAGFVLAAMATAIGLNGLWGYTYYFLQNAFYGMLDKTPPEQTVYTPDDMPLVGMLLMLVWTCLVAPVTEEYMFRGMMLRTLSKHGAGFGIVSTAFAFGMMHGNMAQTPMAFLIGLVMGYVAMKAGGIRQTILIHFVNNCFASIPQAVHYFCPQYDSLCDTVLTYAEYGLILFAAVALLWFCIVRNKGRKARAARLASSGTEAVSRAEAAWSRLEIPESRRLAVMPPVSHRFGRFVASAGMIVFICVMIVNIVATALLPFLQDWVGQMGDMPQFGN